MDFDALMAELKKSTGKTGLEDSRGAYFLNAAMRWLEAEQPLLNTQVYDETTLSQDGYAITFTDAKPVQFIKKIYRKHSDDDSQWSELTYIPLDTMIRKYPELGDTDAGTPQYWSYGSYDVDSIDEDDDVSTIWIMPPADEDVSIRIDYETSMVEYDGVTGAQTTIWGTYYPWILIKAAIMQIDAHYGFVERTRALYESIQMDLDAIDKRLVKREMAAGNVMERPTEAGTGAQQVQYVIQNVDPNYGLTP